MGESHADDGYGLPDDVQVDIRTNVSHDGEGTVYAVQTAKRGKYRVELKIGHIDGTYAEGSEYYFDGESFYSSFYKVPENGPSGKYHDDTFYELLESDTTVEDGKLIEKYVHDADGVDVAEWASNRFELDWMADTWSDAITHHTEGQSE